jgi:hypothetical protein
MNMDLSVFETLGKIAGLGGIAIGLIAMLVRPIIDQTTALPLAQRGPLLRLVAIGAFAIGALGIVAWLGASLGGHNTIVTGGACSNTSAGNATGNSVNCSTVPANTGTKP